MLAGFLAQAGTASKGYKRMREKMVKSQIEARGIRDARVLNAIRMVERHVFVPASERAFAYEDRPLPIGERQTISQPYIVAYMTEAASPKSDDKVLEIGTGSGYQAAVISKLVQHVYSIEIVESLGKRAKEVLKENGYSNVTVRIGDGYAGWPEKALFNVILLTAAPPKIPQPLIDQLAPGGRLIAPVGKMFQSLIRITKSADGKIHREELLPVRFVPMTGKAQE
jgi:protein-L-isoaspartate(D-aspartate) O-methyltransferase